MKIKFISDLHLGKAPQSHSTPDSRKRFQAALYEAAMRAVRPEMGTRVVCLGDLFDKPSNPEAVINQGAEVATYCRDILAGNHDLHGREGVMSSLQLLASMDGEEGGRYMFETVRASVGRVVSPDLIYLVPHQPSQANFEEELGKAQQEAALSLNCNTCILCLHANYDSPFTEGTESALNLTRERAGELLEAFDQIVMGHEHTTRTDFEGRLVMVGSLLPTDFGNISDKYIFVYNTETKKMEADMFWDEAVGSKTVNWKDAGELCLEGMQFVDVVGAAAPSEMPSVAKMIQDIWRRGESLLLVRNGVVLEGTEVEPSEVHKSLDVVDRIRQELEGTELGGLFEAYLAVDTQSGGR